MIRHLSSHTPKSSIFRKLFFYVALLIFPVLIIGISFLFWSKQQLKNELESSAHMRLEHVAKKYSSELLAASSQLNHLLNNKLFFEFYYDAETLSESQYYRSLYEQRLLLKEYPTYYSIAEDITIYYTNLGIALSAANGLQEDSTQNQEDLINGFRATSSLLKKHDNTFYLEDMYPVTSRSTNETPMFFVTMQLSTDYIADLLNSNKEYHSYFYHNTSQTIISSSSLQISEEYITYFDYANDYISQEQYSSTFSWYDNGHYIIANYLPVHDCTFMMIIPTETFFSLPNQLTNFLLVYTLISLVIIVLFYFFSIQLFKQPILSLLSGYKELEKGNLEVVIPTDSSTLEFSLLITGFNKMTSRLRKSLEKTYKYELYSQQMELKQLQLQMNPHFLYNTYFILKRLIQLGDMEKAEDLSSYLGTHFQYITRNVKDAVNLSEEWMHAKNYLLIQSVRFNRRIASKIDELPSRYAYFQVPPLILQPLLENAFEHGLKDTTIGGLISLKFTEKEDSFELTVTDNGNSLTHREINRLNASLHSDAAPSDRISALYNIYRRLKLTYTSDADIVLTPNQPCGLCVTITFKQK